MLRDVADDQCRLQPGGEGIELAGGARQWPIGAAHFAIGEIGTRQIANGAVRKGGAAGEGIGIAQEGARCNDETAHIAAGVGQQIGARIGTRKEGGGAGLLQADVDAEDGGIGGADDPQHCAAGIDQRDRHLRPAVQRLADLRAGAGHHGKCLFEQGPGLAGADRGGDLGGIGPGANRIAVCARAIGQDEGVGMVEFGGARAPHPRCLAAIGRARLDCGHRVIAGQRHQLTQRRDRRGIARARNSGETGIFGIGIAQQGAIDGDAVGPDRLGRFEAQRAGQGDALIRVTIDIEDIGIEAVDAVREDADPADDHAVLVQREAAGICGKPQRRAFGPDQGRRAGGDAGGKVRTGQLAELHAEQGSALQPGGGGRRREMLLDDHACRARGKGVAAARQIGASDSLGDSASLSGNVEPLRILARTIGRIGNARTGRRGGHAQQRKDIADPVGHRDDGRPAVGYRLCRRLRDNPLDIADAERLLGGRGEAGRGRAAARSAARRASPAGGTAAAR